MTDDLIAFLNARLDEEERLANAATHAGLGVDIGPDGQAVSAYPDVQDHFATWNPARVHREVEADRTLIAMWETQSGYDLAEGVHEGRDPDERAADELVKYALYEVLRVRAAVYSDHPDYRGEWKP